MKQLLAAIALIAALGACTSTSTTAAETSANSAPAEQSKDVTRLNAHIRTLVDASKLYTEAAGMAKTPAYAAQLRQLAAAREAMIAPFQREVIARGGSPDDSGGALGAGHMAFMELRSLVQDDTRTAVAEVLRGEKYLVDELTATAQDPDVSAPTHRFAQAQLPGLQADRDRIQAYLDTIEAR